MSKVKNNLWLEIIDAKRKFPSDKKYYGIVKSHYFWTDMGWPMVMIDVEFDTLGRSGYDPALLEQP